MSCSSWLGVNNYNEWVLYSCLWNGFHVTSPCVRPCIVGFEKGYKTQQVSNSLPICVGIMEYNLISNTGSTIRGGKVSKGTIEKRKERYSITPKGLLSKEKGNS
jgi:hypothetical protein